MVRVRPPDWYDDRDGAPVPDCVKCGDLLQSPMFVASVYSVSIETVGDPHGLAKRTIEHYHTTGHKAWP